MRPGVYVPIMVLQRHAKFVVFSAKLSYITELEIPGCDIGIWENRRRAARRIQNNERGCSWREQGMALRE